MLSILSRRRVARINPSPSHWQLHPIRRPGNRPLNIGPNCRRNSGNSGITRSCEFHSALAARFGVHLRYVSSHVRGRTPFQSIGFITNGSVRGLIRFENSCEDIDGRIPFSRIILPLVYFRANCRGCVNFVER